MESTSRPSGRTSPGSIHADAVARLAEIRLVLDAFDWEHDDRQFALEKIDDIVHRDGGVQ